MLSMKVIFALGQYEKNFVPSSFEDTIPSDIYHGLKKRLADDEANLTIKGKEGNYLKSLYDQRFEYVVDSFNEGSFMVDHPLTSTLREIAARIYESNPDLPRDLNIYTFSSSAPNAVSFGEGTICIMLGLLERVETEDQIAYILCHEFAHYYANHAEKNFARLAALNYDKELKKKINDITTRPYGRYSRLKALFNSLDLSVTTHSRTSEFQADSLGLVYYQKTGYNPYSPLRVMQILEHADKGLYRKNIDFRKHFSFKAFPFKDAWTSYVKSNFYSRQAAFSQEVYFVLCKPRKRWLCSGDRIFQEGKTAG
jgi:Zn-dependent protease with chaperone function